MIDWFKNYFHQRRREKYLQELKSQKIALVSNRPYIGIIAELSTQEQLNQLVEFYKEQHWLQIPCNILLYEEDYMFDLPFQFHYYSKKDVNWYDIPDYEKAKAFVGVEYEKLIVLNPQNRKHIHFLASVTSAQMKCGLASLDEFQTYYQLMVELEDAGNYKKAIQEIYDHYAKLV